MPTITWLTLGILPGAAFLTRAGRHGPQIQMERKLIAPSLVVAALMYLVFGIVQGNSFRLLIEGMGVAWYGLVASISFDVLVGAYGLRRNTAWAQSENIQSAPL